MINSHSIFEEQPPQDLPQAVDGKSGQPRQKVDRALAFAMLEDSGTPTMQALRQAGYSPSVRGHDVRATSKYQRYKDEIRRERAGLSRKKGYTLADSAAFYRQRSASQKASDANRIRARECLDKLLGYFAPIEVDDSREGNQQPVIAFLNILNDYKVSPLDLLKMAQSETLKENCINAIMPPECQTESANEE